MFLLRNILDLLLPSVCSHCNGPIDDSSFPRLCSACTNDFALIPGAVCPSCGRPFFSPEALTHSPEHTCSVCRSKPPAFDQAISIGQFEGPLREAIHQFKYRPCRSLGKPLGFWMARHVRVNESFDSIMPVPLHRTRLKHRGFNQSVLLAHACAERTGVPLALDNLVRVRETRPQVELKPDEREKNVADAFGVKRAEAVNGKSILLIDDVYTTGATLNACAAALKSAGASGVVALTLARAV
jgi:ComF family protein